ncbi:MAG: hypothetical protein K9L70_07725 [Thiohalocapsa sp.]|nr:hypothetical protein [Thiohalocapsa sp.]
MSNENRHLSSRDLLNQLGLGDDDPNGLLGNESPDDLLDDLDADPGEILLERLALLNRPHRFAPGDLVTWKPGLKNRRVPRHGRAAVVVAVLAAPLLDSERESGSAYYREPHDLVLGVLWDREPGRGDFVTFHFDSRRFQPWRK